MIRIRNLEDSEREVGLAAILLLLAGTVFVAAPMVAVGAVSLRFIELLRFGLAAITIIIVARTRRVRVIVAVTFIATVAVSMPWSFSEPPRVVAAARLGIGLLFDSVVAGTVITIAFGQGRVTIFRILGAVILYLYVALIFAGLFGIAALFLRDAFVGLPAAANQRFAQLLSFSLGALTTNGSAEVTAQHPLVRSLANLEAVIGQLFPATLLARLVTLHAAGQGDN